MVWSILPQVTSASNEQLVFYTCEYVVVLPMCSFIQSSKYVNILHVVRHVMIFILNSYFMCRNDVLAVIINA